MMHRLTREQELTAELLCMKFKNAITPFDMQRWLYNFKPGERNNMLRVLDFFRYFDENDFLEGYEKCIRELFSKADKKRETIIQPVRGLGKSSSAMIYLFMKAMKLAGLSEKVKYFVSENDYRRFAEKNATVIPPINLILLDDFFGSGRQVLKFYENTVKPACSAHSIPVELFFVSFICTNAAKESIETACPIATVIRYTEEDGVFSQENNGFDSLAEMEKTREICRHYASENNLYYNHPLGHENSQTLVAFSHSTPNNTLPIIWSDKNKWFPLFPRFTDTRISRAKKARKEIARQLGFAKVMGELYFSTRHWKRSSVTYINRENFQLFALLKFKVERKSRLIICKILGIMEQDYSGLMQQAKQENLLDENERVTLNGIKKYNEVIKKIPASKQFNAEKEKLYMREQKVYVPSSFRGKTYTG